MDILFVDDESGFLEQARIFLEREYERLNIDTATSAEKGLKLIEKNDYGAVISDYKMPEMDGLDFLKVLIKKKQLDIPFIIFTGKSREEVAIKALNLGADRYLLKDGDPESRYSVLGEAIIEEAKEEGEGETPARGRGYYRAIVKTSPDGITITNLDGKITDCNQRTLEMHGFDSKNQVIGKDAFELIAPEDRERAEENLMKTLEEEVIRNIEYNFIDNDGNKFPARLSSSVIRGCEGNPISFIAATRDITGQKEREKKLRESKERYKAIVETSPESITITDLEGKVTDCNQRTLEIFGFGSKEEAIGKNAFDFIAPEDRPRAQENLIKTLEEGRISGLEYTFLDRDGNKFPGKISTSVIHDSEDNPVLFLAIIEDITERKKAEERKDFLNTLLRQDLRNKYQTVRGYHQLLEERDLPEEHREYLEKAMEAGREAGEILELAKKLAEIEDKEWISEKDLEKVLEHAIKNTSDLADKKGVNLEIEYPENPGRVKCNYSLKTLFTHTLKTRIQTTDCDRIKIDGRDSKGSRIVRIEDNGERLTEDIKDLFSGSGYTGKTAGIGGARYYTLRQIADHNNAEIEVKNSELGGARFDIHLQRASPEK